MARNWKAHAIVDDDAPLSKYYGREVLNIRAMYHMDADERRLYSFDIRIEDAVTQETVFARNDVPMTGVLSIDFARVRNTRLMAYKLTLHKRG